MRIMTKSSSNSKGLISIIEANEDAEQNVIFCIPIDKFEAKKIKTLGNFNDFFRKGVTTKVRYLENDQQIIHLNFSPDNKYPKFIANVNGFSIDFYLSPSNFLNEKILALDFFYAGQLKNELFNKSLVIIEPNWKQLDTLFREQKILFTDWT